MSAIKILGVGLVAALTALLIKNIRPEQALQISIITGAFVLLYAVAEIADIKQVLNTALTEYGINGEYIGVVFKIIGIAYATQFAADICRDASETAVAAKIELCGRVMIISATLPIVLSVLSSLVSLYA